MITLSLFFTDICVFRGESTHTTKIV